MGEFNEWKLTEGRKGIIHLVGISPIINSLPGLLLGPMVQNWDNPWQIQHIHYSDSSLEILIESALLWCIRISKQKMKSSIFWFHNNNYTSFLKIAEIIRILFVVTAYMAVKILPWLSLTLTLNLTLLYLGNKLSGKKNCWEYRYRVAFIFGLFWF